MCPKLSLSLCSLLYFYAVSTSLAAEPVTIGTILDFPESHHFHYVTLKGTARHIRINPPPVNSYIAQCSPWYLAYSFALEDETGSIEVAVQGRCGRPDLNEVVLVFEGDNIMVDARLFVFPIQTERGYEKHVEAIATKIWHIDGKKRE